MGAALHAEDIGIVTIVHGRYDHLRRQLAWVKALDPQPRVHVVVSMGDAGVVGVVGEHGTERTRLVELSETSELPLSLARNRGVAAVADFGCDAVVLLDVDCLPTPSLVADYAAQLSASDSGPAVVTGRVQYLPERLEEDDFDPARPGAVEHLREVGRDHPARPLPARNEMVATDPALLWSLNIAATVSDWNELGGFDERFVGYGGEDTDFGQRLAAAGGTLWTTSLAGVFHQWHPSSSPPVQHAVAIARNSNLYHSTWGVYPMGDWLRQLEELGVLEFTDGQWVPTNGGRHHTN